MSEQKQPFESWCALELLGHRRLAGYVSAQEIAGQGMLRIDVPGEDGEEAVTQFYSPSALYALTPTTEEIARAFAARNRLRPVSRYELPAPPEREPVEIARDQDTFEPEWEGDEEYDDEPPY